MSKIASLIKQGLAKLDAVDESSRLSQHFNNTLAHIEASKSTLAVDLMNGRMFLLIIIIVVLITHHTHTHTLRIWQGWV